MENNIVREFEALTVYGHGGTHGERGVLMGDLVADLTHALEESGATATAEDLQNADSCLRRHPRKRRLRTLRRRSDPSIKAVDPSGVMDKCISVVSSCNRRRGEGLLTLCDKKYGLKAASDLSESSMDERSGKNKTSQLIRRAGDSDESYLLSLPFSSPSSSNPAPRFHHNNHTANTTGTTPSVEQSVDPSDQSEDNENISLSVSGGRKDAPPCGESQKHDSADKVLKVDVRPRPRADYLLDKMASRAADSRSQPKDQHHRPPTSSSSSRQESQQQKKASSELRSPSAVAAAGVKGKPQHKATTGVIAKDADDFDVSTGTETFTPIRPHRRRRKMTKMSVEVASGPLVEVSDGKGKISPLPNQLIGPDHDHNQNQSCLTPSKKLSKSLSKKGKETKSNSQSSEVAVLLPVFGKRKRTVRDRRASETIEEERDGKVVSEKDDMEFSGDESDIDLSTSWSSGESDLRGNLTNDEGGDLGDDELSDWPDYDEDRNPRDGRGDGDLTLSPELDDTNAMSVEDANLGRRSSLDICKINSKTPLSSDSATTIVQGSPLESSGHKVVPWWDNEDSNNSTICLPSSKKDLEGEDDTLSNILNGLNSLGDLGEGTSGKCSSRNSHGKRSGGMPKSPGARWQNSNSNQRPSSRPHRAGRRRWSESRNSKSENSRALSLANVNEKINKFLQDQESKELWLQPMTKKEREQISKLASLYSLHLRTENGLHQRPCPVLAKTGKTSRPPDTLAIENLLQKSQSKLFSNEGDGKYGHPPVGAFYIGGTEDIKRRRKAPPSGATNERGFHRWRSPSVDDASSTVVGLPGAVGGDAPPLSTTNFGNRLMQNLGWVPGTGLGPTGDGLKEPIVATVRPKRLGLGSNRTSGAGVADGQAAWVRATEDSEDAGIDCGSDSDVLKSEHSVSGNVKAEDDASMQQNSSNHDSFNSLVEKNTENDVVVVVAGAKEGTADSDATSPSLSPQS